MIDRSTPPDNPQLVIDELERQQARAVREAILIGQKARLDEIESDIEWLRQFVPNRNTP